MAIISKLPEGASVLDLDAARVARQEARAAQGLGDPFIKLSAGFVQVKAEIPIAVADYLRNENIHDGLAGLLNDPADVDVLWPTLTSEDFQAIVEFISGKTPGESQA